MSSHPPSSSYDDPYSYTPIFLNPVWSVISPCWLIKMTFIPLKLLLWIMRNFFHCHWKNLINILNYFIFIVFIVYYIPMIIVFNFNSLISNLKHPFNSSTFYPCKSGTATLLLRGWLTFHILLLPYPCLIWASFYNAEKKRQHILFH